MGGMDGMDEMDGVDIMGGTDGMNEADGTYGTVKGRTGKRDGTDENN